MKILIYRASWIYLDAAVQVNGYLAKLCIWDDLTGATVARGMQRWGKPLSRGVTDRIGKLLCRHNVREVYRPTQSIQQHLKLGKDARDPLASGRVYKIPCSGVKVYINTTKWNINTRIAEHTDTVGLARKIFSSCRTIFCCMKTIRWTLKRLKYYPLHYTTWLNCGVPR